MSVRVPVPLKSAVSQMARRFMWSEGKTAGLMLTYALEQLLPLLQRKDHTGVLLTLRDVDSDALMRQLDLNGGRRPASGEGGDSR